MAHVVNLVDLSSFYIDNDPLKAKYELININKNLKEIINDTRDIIFNLRPMSFDDLRLQETLIRLFDKINSKHEFEVITKIEDINNINKDIQLNLYRLIQECFTNAINHSKGNQIVFELYQDDNKIKIKIADNGIGFSKDDLNRFYY